MSSCAMLRTGGTAVHLDNIIYYSFFDSKLLLPKTLGVVESYV